MRTGGTSNTADGTVQATLSSAVTAAAGDAQNVLGAAFANPGAGVTFVKITASNSGAPNTTYIQNYQVTIG